MPSSPRAPIGPGSTAKPAAESSGTVHRLLRILGCFAERDRWRLGELATALGLPGPSAHRLLNLCRPLGFVDQDVDGCYVPGPELYRLAGRLSAEAPLRRLAIPILESLRDEIQETVMLSVLARSELGMFFMAVASPAHPLRYTVELNRLQSLAWGAAGRSLLAYLGAGEIAEVIRRREPSPLDQRPLSPTDLRRSLADIRREGVAVTQAQRSPDTWGIAVPFFDAAGQVHGNFNIAIPDHRFASHDVDDLVRRLRSAVERLTRGLGWQRTTTSGGSGR